MEQVIAYFESIDPILAALYATLFTWGLTAAGAGLVFLFKSPKRALLDGMLGFTGGVMVAASFWSLLAPGIEMSEGEGFVKVIPAAVGFLLGALFIFGLDKVLPHVHINFKNSEAEGVKTPLASHDAFSVSHYPCITFLKVWQLAYCLGVLPQALRGQLSGVPLHWPWG